MGEGGRPADPSPFLRRVRIANFTSMQDVDVTLGPLTILVGLNAAGKSNFLDALRFVSEVLTGSLAQAVAARGGIAAVWRQGVQEQATMRLTINLDVMVEAKDPAHRAGPSSWQAVNYGFDLRVTSDGDHGRMPVVDREWCHLGAGSLADGAAWIGDDGESDPVYPTGFVVERGRVLRAPDYLHGPVAGPGRLLLPAAARWLPFAPVHAALSSMSFHAVSPTVMRQVEVRSGQRRLGPSGERLGEVLGHLARQSPTTKARIDDYVAAIVPGAVGVDEYVLGRRSAVRLRMVDPGTGATREFDPESMSDGTLSAAGTLAALFQPDSLNGSIPLVGVEEPELGLHPTAAGVLLDALTEASEHVQVIAATQSADLLDREDFQADWARVVRMRDGVTTVDPVDEGSRAAVAANLATLGDLLRSNQLTPRVTTSSQEDR